MAISFLGFKYFWKALYVTVACGIFYGKTKKKRKMIKILFILNILNIEKFCSHFGGMIIIFDIY